MELSDYWKIFLKKIWILILSVLVVGAISYFFTVRTPISYDASTNVNVLVKNSQESSNYYNYDGYYGIQASSLFSDTISSWLQDPANIVEIYKKSGIDTSSHSLKNLSKLITTKKRAPATIIININSDSINDAETISKNIIQFIEEKTKNLEKENLLKNVFIEASQSLVVDHKPPVTTNTIAGLIAGIILGIGLIFFFEYIKK